LVVFDVHIKACTVHGIGIVLIRDWAVLAQAGVPRGDYAFLHDAPVVRGGAVIMHMVSSEAPATDFPQRTVVFIVIGRVLVAFKAVREGSGGSGSFALLTW
jgi:hypothetical protein